VYTIKARFERFSDWRLDSLIGAVGVYVIWDAKSKARPTYIGEGNVLKRLSDHVERDGRKFAHPWDGYIALLVGSTRGVHKFEAKAIERLLLDIAEATDRYPAANSHPGSFADVLGYCKNETLRVAISGFDPLLPPRTARPMRGSKEVTVRRDRAKGIVVNHDWRWRRLRKAIGSSRE